MVPNSEPPTEHERTVEILAKKGGIGKSTMQDALKGTVAVEWMEAKGRSDSALGLLFPPVPDRRRGADESFQACRVVHFPSKIKNDTGLFAADSSIPAHS